MNRFVPVIALAALALTQTSGCPNAVEPGGCARHNQAGRAEAG